MTKPRTGYRNVTFQIPDAVYTAIERVAEQKRDSLTSVLIDGLCRAFKVPVSKIPLRRRPGRRPKKRD